MPPKFLRALSAGIPLAALPGEWPKAAESQTLGHLFRLFPSSPAASPFLPSGAPFACRCLPKTTCPVKPMLAKIRVMGVQKPFGRTWWGNAWVKAMERIDYNTNRLPRGRRYANNGSVLDIQIEGGEVLASVQGSRPKPYLVRIRLNEFKIGETKKIKDLVGDNIAVAADLSLGKLPESMLDLLEKEGIRLLPRTGARSPPAAPAPTGRIRASTWPPSTTSSATRSTRIPSSFSTSRAWRQRISARPEASSPPEAPTKWRERDCYTLTTGYRRSIRSCEQPAADGAIAAPDVDLAFPAVDIDALIPPARLAPFLLPRQFQENTDPGIPSGRKVDRGPGCRRRRHGSQEHGDLSRP